MLVNYFAERSGEISPRIGEAIDLARQKPYTGTHNSGYTECQEFFGVLGRRIVTILDVALRGIGDRWNDVVIPGFDYCVVENLWGSTMLAWKPLQEFRSTFRNWSGCSFAQIATSQVLQRLSQKSHEIYGRMSCKTVLAFSWYLSYLQSR